jgi:hypothetical protein
MKTPLTKGQKKILADIHAIAVACGQNHWDIETFPPESRTPYLKMMRQQLITSEVVKTYTFVDELLSVIICHYYFRKPKGEFSFQKLWRTKKFKAFAYNVLDSLYPLQKMRMVNEIREIPKDHRQTIDRLNNLRNSLTHSFFPENRKIYAEHKRVIYRDHDIFTVAGFDKFNDETTDLTSYLFKRAFGFTVP